MKIADIRFPHDTRSEYLRTTITRRPTPGIASEEATAKTLRRLIRNAPDTETLIDMILSSDELVGTSERAAVMQYERPDRLWREIRAAMGDACFKTESDAGAVRCGSESFSVLIRNGRGDGTTRVAVFEDDAPAEIRPFLNTVMIFAGTLDGSFAIYDYDCSGGLPVRQLEGRYAAYAYDGLVVLTKWR